MVEYLLFFRLFASDNSPQIKRKWFVGTAVGSDAATPLLLPPCRETHYLYRQIAEVWRQNGVIVGEYSPDRDALSERSDN